MRKHIDRIVNEGLVRAYCRVSTKKEQQETPLEEQITWAQSFANERGATLEIFRDQASGATTEGRADFLRMLASFEDPQQAKPCFLIATSLDRVSRDMTDTLLLRRVLERVGTKLYIRGIGEVPLDSAFEQAMLVLRALGGQAENEERSRRMSSSFARRRREGKPTSNKSPWGLQLQGERDVREPGTAPWVVRAFEWYASGIGMYRIAQRLRSAPAHCVTTSRIGRDGKPIISVRKPPSWESNRVAKILRQRRYRDTIVPAELFDTVQDMLSRRRGPRLRARLEYPFSGAVKCAGCGRSFHGHATGGTRKKKLASGEIRVYPSERTRYYSCTVCNYRISAKTFEGWVKSAVDHLIASPQLIERWLRPADQDELQRALKAELARIDSDLDPIRLDRQKGLAWDAAMSGDAAVRADLPAQLRRINDRQAQLAIRRQEILNQLQESAQRERRAELAHDLLDNLWSILEGMSYPEQRELWWSLLVGTLGGVVADKGGLRWLQPHISPIALAPGADS